MAKLYADEDESLFGPVSQKMPLSDDELEELSDEEKAQVKKEVARVKSCITKEYNRIVEKSRKSDRVSPRQWCQALEVDVIR